MRIIFIIWIFKWGRWSRCHIKDFNVIIISFVVFFSCKTHVRHTWTSISLKSTVVRTMLSVFFSFLLKTDLTIKHLGEQIGMVNHTEKFNISLKDILSHHVWWDSQNNFGGGKVEKKVSAHVNYWVGRRKVLNRCLLKIWVRDHGPQCHCQSHADARGILWLWRKLIVGTEGSSCSARQHWCLRGNKGCCLRARAHAK